MSALAASFFLLVIGLLALAEIVRQRRAGARKTKRHHRRQYFTRIYATTKRTRG